MGIQYNGKQLCLVSDTGNGNMLYLEINVVPGRYHNNSTIYKDK